jgi:putative transposase
MLAAAAMDAIPNVIHEQARTRPQDLSLFVALTALAPAELGVGDRYHLHPDGAGFVNLAVLLDWFGRRVLSWPLSITMEAAFCVETLKDALARYGKPNIFYTDQGLQFTGEPSPARLSATALQSAWRAKAPGETTCFVERLWRSIKYEEAYLRARDSVSPRLTRPLSGTSTVPYPIKPTSTNCPSTWQPNPGRDSTYRNGISIQTTATSLIPRGKFRNMAFAPGCAIE